MNPQKPTISIAIIGSGIAGLTCAYHLHKDFNVTIFEKEPRLGGHTDTHSLTIDNKKTAIDSGFIVFCRRHYPHFTKMLDELGVETQSTDMSFSVHNKKSGLVYNATSLNSLFCQRKNLLSPKFYRMIFDIVRFYIESPSKIESLDATLSLEDYLESRHYSKSFKEDHFYPMVSALWSATPERVKQYPIKHLLEYLSSHGMLNLFNRPQWLAIKGGSNQYIKALEKAIDCKWHLNSKINSVERYNEGVKLKLSSGRIEGFNKVVFATHANQALRLLESPSKQENEVLGSFEFEQNHTVIHTDETIMHPNRASWASWNTEVPENFNAKSLPCCTANYWMNSLMALAHKTNVFVSLNTHQQINPDKIFVERHYAHPIFTADSVAAQKRKHLIDGNNNSYFVGAYWGYGFHEDGARSAADVSELIKSEAY